MNVMLMDDKPAAIVLAGGKSSRMGRPKALLPFDGEPLLVHIVRGLQPMFHEIVVVGDPQHALPLLPAKIIWDEVPYQGPVAGIYYGLQAVEGVTSFVCSCDVPFLDPSLIAYLLSCVQDYDIVVPYWAERFQPLHAIYRRDIAPILRRRLDEGKLRSSDLFEAVRTRIVGEEELRRIDPEGLSFINLNNPEEYQRALALWHKRRVNCAKPKT